MHERKLFDSNADPGADWHLEGGRQHELPVLSRGPRDMLDSVVGSLDLSFTDRFGDGLQNRCLPDPRLSHDTAAFWGLWPH